jgi:hypothetical protein
MLFCQLGQAHSLREICNGLASCFGKYLCKVIVFSSSPYSGLAPVKMLLLIS